MAGNFGKFIDRSPIICAAGVPTISNETVASTLKEYSLEDKVTAIKHDSNIWTEGKFIPPKELPPIENACFRGTNTELIHGDVRGLSQSTVCRIIRNVSVCLAEQLNNYIYFPRDDNSFTENTAAFYRIANFPRVSGCIDCTHIRIENPGGDQAEVFRNRKGWFSLNIQIRSILNPPVKTRYQELIENLKETPYDSYWNKQDGKGKDQVPGLPTGMVPHEVTFGKPSTKETSLKELVNPPKTPYQVLWDSQVGHEMYKQTHCDYNPSEQINRGYSTPPYNPERCFGAKTKYDPRGIWTKCACHWYKTEPITHASRIQAEYLERVKPQVGKSLTPNHNIECVPKGHTFGNKTKRALYGVEELLKDPGRVPCIFKRDFYEWMASLNKLRIQMKEKSNISFNFDDFYKKSLYWDKEKCGFLPLDTFYKLCSCEHITFRKADVESLLKVLNIIVDDKIDYKKFIDIINVNKPFMEIMKFEKDDPLNTMSKCSHHEPENIEPAGINVGDIDGLGEESTVKALINPSIYTNYGLNYRDFFVPRSAETIKNLFEKIGYNFPGDTFEKLWKKGLELDQTGYVCIETFKSLLNTHCPPPKLLVDEKDCEEKNKK